uniref:uncharacterized protein LOC124054716 isoform X2 n=2 Tax=Scatophagus argus TaxID=75038 RepID=UPI001ED85D45|nr:uncharacterized protein LOC124054716 isoform X2 [Scatophagus argus]
MAASGALHTNERFLFSCLSECVRVSSSDRQRRVCVPGGVRVQEPPTSTGPGPVGPPPAPTPAPSTLRAWSRKPMKSRELRTVTEDRRHDSRCPLTASPSPRRVTSSSPSHLTGLPTCSPLKQCTHILDQVIKQTRNAMVCALVSLVLTVLLAFSSSGAEPSSPCPPQWLPLGQRCFAFYPVWSSWTTAKSMCSQTGGDLASLHTPEERSFVEKLASTHTPVWLGGHQPQQNGAWNWTDGTPFRISGWTNQELGNTREACLQMEPKSGELHAAPCGELRFYICSTKTSSQVVPEVRKPPEPGIVPNVSLFDVTWSYSDSVAEEILRSSSFLKELWSGHLTPRRYASFMQQEALYLHRVSSTLEALLSSLGEADDVSSLLQDTLKDYSSRNQSLAASPAPQWLHSSLQSFHPVVLEEPVYWLVALSARACLWGFLAQEQPRSERWTGGSPPGTDSLYQEWREESLKEVEWTQRYRKVIEKHQDQMDVFKAVNIFREHMMNQKSFYKMLDADVADDRE